MAKPRNFLFICRSNGARSQMAEGFARHLAGAAVNVFSAGVRPNGLNQVAIEVMDEIGIDISGQRSKDFKDLPASKIDTVITLCANADDLPDKLSKKKKINQIHWPLTDPATVGGSDAEVKKAFRAVRDEIRNRVQVLLVG